MRILGLCTVAAAVVALSAADASAWGRRGGSSGSSGSYSSYGSSGSSGSSGSYSSYGSSGSSSSYGSSGSHGRMGLFARWHARKAAKASHGSYGSSGSYSSYGSSGSSSSYGSHGSSGGSYASSGSYGGGYYNGGVEVAPMEAQPMIEGAPAEATPPTPPQPAEPAQASIRVMVPADAIVFVNDRPTTSTGESRHYISRNLLAGRTYAYDLRVEYKLDGKPMVESKTVRLQGGANVELSFGNADQMASDAQEAKTKVTLHVPAGAKVTLAGAETKQTGETRTFITSTLKEGQKWDGYVVRVELERDGQTLTEEKNLAIVGGESYELSFDFAGASNHLASN
jgi:uncharacterized protein (TIGR03000 family)